MTCKQTLMAEPPVMKHALSCHESIIYVLENDQPMTEDFNLAICINGGMMSTALSSATGGARFPLV